MPIYARIGVVLPKDEAIRRVGLLGELLYIRFILACKEIMSDGVLHHCQFDLISVGFAGKARKIMASLVREGLIKKTEQGWEIPPEKWSSWQETRDEILAKRQANKKRVAKYRSKESDDCNAVSNGVTNAVTNALVTQPDNRQQTTDPKKKDYSHATSYTGKPPSDPVMACALISDFYSRWVNPQFKPPMFSSEEVALAEEIVKACGSLEKAKAAQKSVIEEMRGSFPKAHRFKASEVSWRKKLAAAGGVQKQQERAESERKKRETEAAKAQQAEAANKAAAERVRPQWAALAPSEREKFLGTIPVPFRSNELFVLTSYAESLGGPS